MKALFILFIFLTCASSLRTQGNWILTKEQDGIKIYNRHSDHSKFDDVKVETDFAGNISQIAAILLDVAKYPEWAYATKSCMLIKKISNSELIYYSEIDAPWPVTNRDFYAHCKVTIDYAARSLKMLAESIKDYGPPKENIVRLPLSKGTWNITTISDKAIHVEYTLELDPGGLVPAWMLNVFSTKGPFETFSNLKKKMQLLNK